MREVAIEEMLGRSAKRGEPGAVYRADAAVLREKLTAAESLLECATRFVFGNHQAIMFLGEGPMGWRVFRMKGATFEEAVAGGLTQAAAVALAQRLHAEALT